jgi:hypothetical protein
VVWRVRSCYTFVFGRRRLSEGWLTGDAPSPRLCAKNLRDIVGGFCWSQDTLSGFHTATPGSGGGVSLSRLGCLYRMRACTFVEWGQVRPRDLQAIG